MKDELDGAAASSGAVRDGSGLSAVPSSASPNPNRGVAPPSAADTPSRDGDALPVFVCDVDESAGLRDGPGDPIKIYCRGVPQQAAYVGGGRAMCPCCRKKRRVVW